MAKIQLFLQKKYVKDAKTNKTMCKLKKDFIVWTFSNIFF